MRQSLEANIRKVFDIEGAEDLATAGNLPSEAKLLRRICPILLQGEDEVTRYP